MVVLGAASVGYAVTHVADSSRTITGAHLHDPLNRVAALHKDLPAHPLWGGRYAEWMLDELIVTAGWTGRGHCSEPRGRVC